MEQDRFQIVSELGRGGMGVVYHARDGASGRDVALKVVLERPSEVRLERFRREGEITAALRHPGIVGIHACGEFDGRPYLAYELVEGRNLEEAMRELSLEQRVAVIRDAAAGLGFAHSKGVVHRDVKPANILVDGAGRGRVADFGLATAADLEKLTRTGAFMGTPSHMAPEQVGGEAVGPPADVWALGVVLFEAACGELPFEGDSELELIGRILVGRPPSLRSADPTVPRALDAICHKAMARAPAARYPDGAALAAALQGYLDGEDSGAPRWAPLAAVALAALAVLGGLAAWGAGGEVDLAVETQAGPAPLPAAAPQGLSAADVRAGRRDLDAISTRGDPRSRHAKATRWLERYADHPDAARARELRRRAQLEFPVLTIAHERDRVKSPVPQTVQGYFISDTVLATQGKGTLRCWDLEALGAPRWEIPTVPSRFGGLGVSPDRTQVVLWGGPEQGTVRVDVATGAATPLGRGLSKTATRHAVFSPDGTLLVLTTLEEGMTLVSWPSGDVLRSIGLNNARDVSFSPDGREFVVGAAGFTRFTVGTQQPTVTVFAAASGEARRQTPVPAPPAAALWCGDVIVLGDEIGNLLCLDAATLEIRRRLERAAPSTSPVPTTGSAHDGSVRGLMLTSDGSALFSVSTPGGRSGTGDLTVWSFPAGEELRRSSWDTDRWGISRSPDGTRCVVGGARGTVEIHLAQGR